MNLEEILMLEEHAEVAFVTLLTPVVPSAALIYRSRLIRVQETPSVGIKVKTGAAQRKHSHVFQNPNFYAPDAYIGELRTKVKTNRTTDAQAPSHTQILGRLRAFLNASLMRRQNLSPVLTVIDCWEDDCDDSEEDADNLDVSEISWFLVLQIKPDVWPANPFT